MGRLAGKRALVTAAGQGIGRASALMMAREGAKVIAADINPVTLAELAELGLETRLLNVRDKEAVAAAAAEVGAVDILFNCAGYVAGGTILDCSEEDWAFSLDLNMTAMYRMCRAFLPAMLENGGGSIVNMASNAILPGVVEGERIRKVIEAKAEIAGKSSAEIQTAWLAHASIKALIQPEQLADVMLLLASPRGRTISGQAISIDGNLQALV